eukprot:TRINITY_DN33833_c0_g1_i2.p1 TRINITY_DN33833_c0_g1~~TRINITY_DN33833_c0_g1_i2.p1  ORF type:complete len:162 (+),score=16.80 TRINITY_DN33833_c0_g1_i2:282-767(+)
MVPRDKANKIFLNDWPRPVQQKEVYFENVLTSKLNRLKFPVRFQCWKKVFCVWDLFLSFLSPRPLETMPWYKTWPVLLPMVPTKARQDSTGSRYVDFSHWGRGGINVSASNMMNEGEAIRHVRQLGLVPVAVDTAFCNSSAPTFEERDSQLRMACAALLQT